MEVVRELLPFSNIGSYYSVVWLIILRNTKRACQLVAKLTMHYTEHVFNPGMNQRHLANIKYSTDAEQVTDA